MQTQRTRTKSEVSGLSRKRAKAAYSGGLVLEPKRGLYDTYILLDSWSSRRLFWHTPWTPHNSINLREVFHLQVRYSSSLFLK